MTTWEHFLSYYPLQDDPEIQQIISAKEEFRQLESDPTEPVPARGDLYRHQQFVVKYMREYDNLLIMHQPGTGKTCAMVGVAEWFRNHPGTIKQTVILVRGNNLKNEFRRQIICNCTDGRYETDPLKLPNTSKNHKLKINKLFEPFYILKTYQTFANDVSDISDERLKELFSDTLFLVDEVHNITEGETEDAVIFNPNEPVEKKVKQQQDVYSILWKLFHLVDRSKVILASATPMIDQPEEIASIMNLILPPSNQLDPITIRKNINKPDILKTYLKPYFNGRISYVRALDTGLDITYQGKVVPNSTVITYNERMDKFQNEFYIKYVQEKSDFERAPRQASNFVFPDGSIGGSYTRVDPIRQLQNKIDEFKDRRNLTDNERRQLGFYLRQKEALEQNPILGKSGLSKYVDSPRPNVYIANNIDNFKNRISDINELRKMSNKYATIIELCKNRPGNCFCYNPFLLGSGAILLGVCFEAQGFKRYPQKIESVDQPEILKPYCQTGTTEAITIPKDLRYALITSDSSENEIDDILKLFNSPKNVNGEYLKVIIGSPITREGLNLSNVVQIHMVAPSWNQSTITQALARALRATSHVELLRQKQIEYMQRGLDPVNARIQVDIYQHASEPRSSSTPNTDERIYIIAQNKDKNIAVVERIMKEVSVDCQINKRRNQRGSDQDNTSECNYTICKYECINSSPDYIDISSYQTEYSDNIVEPIKKIIIEYMKTHSTADISQLYDIVYDFLPNTLQRIMNESFLYQAIVDIIDNYIPILNYENSIQYLQSEGEMVYLTSDFPYYGRDIEYMIPVPSILNSRSFDKLEVKQDTKYLLTQLEAITNIRQFYQDLTFEQRVELTESILMNSSKDWTARQKQWLKFIENYLFIVKDRTDEIQALIRQGVVESKKKIKLPKIKLDAIEKLPFMEAVDRMTDDYRIIHTLLTTQQKQTDAGALARQNKAEQFKILDEDDKWTVPSDVMMEIYSPVLQHIIEYRRRDLEKLGIYIFLRLDGQILIRDNTTEKVKEKDKRGKQNGKNCNSWTVEDLIKLMYRLNPRFPLPIVYEELNPNLAIQLIAEEFDIDIEDLRNTLEEKKDEYMYYANMIKYTKDNKKEQLCQKLREYMIANNRYQLIL